MYFIYFLRSIDHPDQTYVGYTSNLVVRIKQHNAGLSNHTRKFRPWKIETFVLVESKELAKDAEKYFKNKGAWGDRLRRYIDKNPEEHSIVSYFQDIRDGEIFGRSRFQLNHLSFPVFRPCKKKD